MWSLMLLRTFTEARVAAQLTSFLLILKDRARAENGRERREVAARGKKKGERERAREKEMSRAALRASVSRPSARRTNAV